MTRRYLGTYGPTTRDEFACWFGIPSPGLCERWILALGGQVTRVEVDGVPAWMLTEHVAEAAAARPSGAVCLLPAFDQYVVETRRYAAMLTPARKTRVYRPRGWLSPVLLTDGGIDGIWRHETTGSLATFHVEPFTAPPACVRRGVEGEAV
ncbi:MAG: winged helix DNA-binding domain-containing protein [Chloroflexota bacterium]|nr:winged helix DNA-binding domain-containing protein [Chloroflexota bacterium]